MGDLADKIREVGHRNEGRGLDDSFAEVLRLVAKSNLVRDRYKYTGAGNWKNVSVGDLRALADELCPAHKPEGETDE